MTEPQLSVVQQKRKLDVLGLVAVILAAVLLVPTLIVVLIGLIPEMNAIWWLGIVLIPLLAVAGVIVIALSVVGIVIGVRRRSRYILSAIGALLGVLMVAPIAVLFLG